MPWIRREIGRASLAFSRRKFSVGEARLRGLSLPSLMVRSRADFSARLREGRLARENGAVGLRDGRLIAAEDIQHGAGADGEYWHTRSVAEQIT